MHDVIVVGARCAGAATGMLLARKGYRVLVVDRARFPSDTISTHWVHEPGVAKLQSWGLLDAVRASGCPPITQMVFDAGPFTLRGSPTPLDGVAESLAPRRTVLDAILVEAARASGAEVREGFLVHELLADEDAAVTGILGGAGSAVAEHARVVVGADGRHSLVARTVQAPMYHEKPPLALAYYAYWSGLPTGGVEFYPRPGAAPGLIPTNDGLTCVVVGWKAERFHEFRRDVEGNFLGTIAEHAPALRERIAAGRRETRFVGTADLPNFYRKPYGPGWALVGDAGFHKDPITAQGITDAFRDAELLAEAIDDGLGGRRDLEEALAGYEAARNEASLPMYELTCELATLDPPPPHMQQLLGALRTNQEQVNRFFGVIAGTVPVQEFFAPENLGRIMSAA